MTVRIKNNPIAIAKWQHILFLVYLPELFFFRHRITFMLIIYIKIQAKSNVGDSNESNEDSGVDSRAFFYHS